MDPHGKLPLKGSRLVRVYKDAKRPILGGSGRLDRGQVCSRHKGDHPKPTTAATGDHLAELSLWRGKSVHIEICDGTPTPVNMKRGRDQTAFDEAECWSQSEESEDEDELEVSETNHLTPKVNQHVESSQIKPQLQVPRLGMQALSNAERIWLNEYFNFHLINTSISRSNNTNVHIFDDILLEDDSEDDFDEMPPLTG